MPCGSVMSEHPSHRRSPTSGCALLFTLLFASFYDDQQDQMPDDSALLLSGS